LDKYFENQKGKLKTTIIILLISTLLVLGCEKAKYENTGSINGQALTLCACCGGYFIDIDGTQYRFQKDELPENFTFEDNMLPMKVELDWDRKTEACVDFNWITVLKI
jgi:hypothetical protein